MLYNMEPVMLEDMGRRREFGDSRTAVPERYDAPGSTTRYKGGLMNWLRQNTGPIVFGLLFSLPFWVMLWAVEKGWVK